MVGVIMVICCTNNTVIAEGTYVEMHIFKKCIKRNSIISHNINNNNDDHNCNNCSDNSINNNDDDNKKNNYIHILNGSYTCVLTVTVTNKIRHL